MAEHTRKYFTCDRCGAELCQPVRGSEKGPTAFSMSAFQDFGVAGGVLFKWNDLCSDCNSYVEKTARQLVDDAKKHRAKQ